MRRLLLVSPVLLASLAFAACGHDEPAGSGTGTPKVASTGAVVASASASSSASSAAITASPTAPKPARSATQIDKDLAEAVVYPEPKVPWRKLRKVNWRGDAASLPPLPPEVPRDAGHCPVGMLALKGGFLLDREGREDTDGVQLEQNAVCSKWRTEDKGINGLCDVFDRDRWLARTKDFPRKRLDVCIDRYEFPNRYGEYPLVVATYAESAGYCEREGKRLCSESEWTFACEGEEAIPYPYGYARDASACAMDRYGPAPGRDTLRPRMTAETAKGLDLSFLASRAGEMTRCTSPFGVGDLTGNVDEWTKTVRRFGYEMIMKGGHWGPARQRCRPQTRGHGPQYVRYDQGFRCCSAPAPTGAGAPSGGGGLGSGPPDTLAASFGGRLRASSAARICETFGRVRSSSEACDHKTRPARLTRKRLGTAKRWCLRFDQGSTSICASARLFSSFASAWWPTR